MSTTHFLFALIFTATTGVVTSYPYGLVGGVPVVHAAPLLGRPIAFSNGPIFTSLTPSLHPIYGTPSLELRNIIRSNDRDTIHFSKTLHRSSAFPFQKKNLQI
ncbi:unnamed protein product [Cylicocyclus nassatus]|uniref:Uncharacterized protein n=1 Tax=Cylicocyclus nassatus TaxID=53992 RepID=A0AA36M276_CYLNA|nr:unnamed protein product [Cylicocyclus nassatus]